jgi:hypothetical protein
MSVDADRQKAFEEFMRKWVAERIVTLGPNVDPSDREYFVKQRANELNGLALEHAFRAPLHEAANPYGGVLGYVRHIYEKAERK